MSPLPFQEGEAEIATRSCFRLISVYNLYFAARESKYKFSNGYLLAQAAIESSIWHSWHVTRMYLKGNNGWKKNVCNILYCRRNRSCRGQKTVPWGGCAKKSNFKLLLMHLVRYKSYGWPMSLWEDVAFETNSNIPLHFSRHPLSTLDSHSMSSQHTWLFEFLGIEMVDYWGRSSPQRMRGGMHFSIRAGHEFLNRYFHFWRAAGDILSRSSSNTTESLRGTGPFSMSDLKTVIASSGS